MHGGGFKIGNVGVTKKDWISPCKLWNTSRLQKEIAPTLGMSNWIYQTHIKKQTSSINLIFFNGNQIGKEHSGTAIQKSFQENEVSIHLTHSIWCWARMTATWESIVQLARQGEPLQALERTDSQNCGWWMYGGCGGETPRLRSFDWRCGPMSTIWWAWSHDSYCLDGLCSRRCGRGPPLQFQCLLKIGTWSRIIRGARFLGNKLWKSTAFGQQVEPPVETF